MIEPDAGVCGATEKLSGLAGLAPYISQNLTSDTSVRYAAYRFFICSGSTA